MASTKLHDLTPEQEEALLTEIRQKFDYATDAWREIRQEADTDMLCVSGKVWEAMDSGGLKQRREASRPALNLDELGQYINQVVNDVRANPRAVKFSPTGNGANDKTAEFYSNKTREIEYRSHAQMVYTTAFENAVQRSYGFCRVNTRFASPRSFNQDIWLEAIPNPDLVTPDPDALKPDGSDMKFCFIAEWWNKADFAAAFPHAQFKDFSTEIQNTAPSWFQGEKIQLAEFWKVKTRQRKLLLLNAPEGMPPLEVFEDEYAKGTEPKPDEIAKTREVEDQTVCQYLTNGVEILKITEWPGKYIPIASCYGKVLYLNEGAGTKRKILSMVRLARDPFMLYCYYRTAQAEVVGMTPKTPYMAYEGQFSPEQLVEVQKSLHVPVAVLQARATIEGLPAGTPLPLPQRQPYVPEIERLEMGAEAARRAIQAAMGGAPLPTSAQRKNEKSGKALQQIEESAQKGNFHFMDHYDDMIKHVGVMIEDLMDKVYDTAREVGIRKQDETAALVQINNPAQPDAIDTKGDHLVTVSTGPSYDSEREAAGDFADTLIGSPLLQLLGPEKAPKIISLAVKLKNIGPLGDEMAKIISPEPEGPQDPAQMAQQLEEAKGQLQQLGQAAEAMKQEIEQERAKQAATVEKARIDADADVRKAEIAAKNQIKLQSMKNAAAISVAHIAASAKGAALDAHATEETIALASDALEADKDREHEKEMADFNARHAFASDEAAAARDAAVGGGAEA